MLLAIDTATQLLSIALHDGDSLLAEYTAVVGRRHSATLAPLIKQIMAQAALPTDSLSALAVAIGPGSYTGLRIGVALAKGMAAAHDLPLVPVTTFEAIVAAQAARPRTLPLIAVIPAGRNRAIWAEYQRQGDSWREQRAPQISAWQDLLASCSQPGLISGEITEAGLRAIQATIANGARLQLLPAAERLRRAGFLAEVAWRRLRDCEGQRLFPADQVMPLYLKTPG